MTFALVTGAIIVGMNLSFRVAHKRFEARLMSENGGS